MNKPILVLLSTLLLPLFSNFSNAAEEQIFIDDMTVPQLRNQIDIIQQEIYRVFNLSTEDDQLKIVCHDYLPTGSSIKREVCEPQFVISERTDNARSARRGANPLLTPRQLQGSLNDEFQILSEAMAALRGESEYFEELNTIAGVLNARLEEIRK
ncbi:MAG: hypothetical protein JKY86_06820 [Gammaproteobacteria bacterium]|nr:hypothetical protein [Gammaproteobacteria bacterium]